MAERLAEFPNRPRAHARYPYDEWCDGGTWQAKRGDDFECQTRSFIDALKAAAKRRHQKIIVTRRGDTVTFKFLPTSTESDVGPRTGDAA